MIQPCAKEPFVGTQQFEIPFGTTITRLNRFNKGLGFAWQMFVCRRPGIPIYGVSRNATTAVLVRLAVLSPGICDVVPETLYTPTGVFAVAAILYDDAAMTVPHLGDSFVVDTSNGNIWSLNPLTGALIAVTAPAACTVITLPSAFTFAKSTKGNEGTLLSIAIDAYLASYNFVQGISGNTTYVDGQYGDYLYRKISADSCLLNRYLEVYNKMTEFFSLHAAIPAYTLAIYNELTAQVEKIMRESDKQMAIPPGTYEFDAGSAAQASLEAWFAADNTLAGLFSIELVTT